MDIASIVSLVIATGSALATCYFWAVRRNAEAPQLDGAWLAAGKPQLRHADDAPTSWLGLECRTVVTNLSTLPNVLLGTTSELRREDGRWDSGKPPRALIVGSPTPLPLELPAQQATEVSVWVWVEVPARNSPAQERARECLAWPPVLRLRLEALEGRSFTLELPLAEEA